MKLYTIILCIVYKRTQTFGGLICCLHYKEHSPSFSSLLLIAKKKTLIERCYYILFTWLQMCNIINTASRRSPASRFPPRVLGGDLNATANSLIAWFNMALLSLLDLSFWTVAVLTCIIICCLYITSNRIKLKENYKGKLIRIHFWF